jgi:tRNA(Ile)-lysidine synthase
MALAFMCSRVAKYRPSQFRVSDNPVSGFYGIVIDHGLRQGSDVEASRVVRAVRSTTGIDCAAYKLRWSNYLTDGLTHPSQLPNFESVARRLRYRKLGHILRTRAGVSLFTAHHQDDQYETVLMRLMGGHGLRGLRGIRPRNDIPESYDLHTTYQSGFIEDRDRSSPYYILSPLGKDRRKLRNELQDEIDPEILAQELREGVRADAEYSYLEDVFDASVKSSKWAPPLAPLSMEDGGVQVYRPLLGFSKAELIATCRENKIPWFEDATNSDPTLTPRNALRHMVHHHELPVALQKPAILELSSRSADIIARLDAEIDRLMRRSLAVNLRTNTSTAAVELPVFSLPRPYRKFRRSRASRIVRLRHYREVASGIVQRITRMIAPHTGAQVVPNIPPWVIDTLFPSLAVDEDGDVRVPSQAEPPKPFTLNSVYFVHLVPTEVPGPTASRAHSRAPRWFLSRAPYNSSMPMPQDDFSSVSFRYRWRLPPSRWPWSKWWRFHLYDGRFWIRIRSRLNVQLRVAPFMPEHAKPFREALEDDGARAYLAAMLKRYAPGKVRYTLPGIYVVGDDTGVLDGDEEYWKRVPGLDRVTYDGHGQDLPVTAQPLPNWVTSPLTSQEVFKLPVDIRGSNKGTLWYHDIHWEYNRRQKAGKHTGRLLALPTLGVQIPGTEKWFQYEIRYRKVDKASLGNQLLAVDDLDGEKMAHAMRKMLPLTSRRRLKILRRAERNWERVRPARRETRRRHKAAGSTSVVL